MRTAYIYLDIDHPAVAWGTYRGVLVSAHADASHAGCAISMMLAGMLANKSAARLQNELLIEYVRQTRHLDHPSRLSAMYFFENKKCAESAQEWGGHFISEHLTAVDLHATNLLSRHDANWITFAPLDAQDCITSADWIDSYWNGAPYPDKTPVWEILSHGRATILDTRVKKRAYKNVSERDPMSVALLEVARICAATGSDLGQIKTFLVANNSGATIEWHMDMRDAENPIALEKIKNFKGYRNFKDLAVGGEKFGVPNMLPYYSNITLNEPVSELMLKQVHMSNGG